MPADPNVSTLSTLNGQVSGLGNGVATLELLVDNSRQKSASNPVIAKTQVGASGAFGLKLPGATALDSYLLPVSLTISTAQCSGELTSSTPGARSFEFAVLDLTRNSIYVDSLLNVSAEDQSDSTTYRVTVTGRRWAYLDQATTMGGSYACQDVDADTATTINSTYHWNSVVKAGWNVQTETTVFTGQRDGPALTAETTVTTAADAPTTWIRASSLTTLSLHDNVLRSAARLVRSHL